MAAQSYMFQTVVVSDATDGTWLGGINNAGEVAGYDAGFGSNHYPFAFTYANGTFTPLPISMAAAHGINNLGWVVGSTGSSKLAINGFLWSNGAAQKISSRPDAPSFGIDTAYGVNDQGQVVGVDYPGGNKGFLWQNGSMSFFQVPGASATEAHGINNAGVIVGTADNRGMVDIGGQFSSLEVPGAAVTDPMAINNGDVIVGSVSDGQRWHGFIDAGGRLQFIDKPGATDTFLTGINDAGILVGYTDTGVDTPVAGFIASPMDPFETLVGEDYRAAFAREAEPAGLKGWAGLLRAGMTPGQLANDLAGSAEFQADHGQQSDADYVGSLYVNALGRHAEPAGLAGWVGMLQAGASRGDVLAAISQSPEGQQHFAAG